MIIREQFANILAKNSEINFLCWTTCVGKTKKKIKNSPSGDGSRSWTRNTTYAILLTIFLSKTAGGFIAVLSKRNEQHIFNATHYEISKREFR